MTIDWKAARIVLPIVIVLVAVTLFLSRTHTPAKNSAHQQKYSLPELYFSPLQTQIAQQITESGGVFLTGGQVIAEGETYWSVVTTDRSTKGQCNQSAGVWECSAPAFYFWPNGSWSGELPKPSMLNSEGRSHDEAVKELAKLLLENAFKNVQ